MRFFRRRTETPWWWLSFCDASLPPGSQFLGGCYVQAAEIGQALAISHALGINPGGEVAFAGPLEDKKLRKMVTASDRHRLLSKAEIEEPVMFHSDDDSFVTAEEALIGPEDGVINTMLKNQGCTCHPQFIIRTIPADNRSRILGYTENGDPVLVTMGEGTEGVLEHEEGCAHHRADPFAEAGEQRELHARFTPPLAEPE